MQGDIQPISPPASIYLGHLASVTRKSVRLRLDTLAGIALPGSDATTFPWQQLTYRETAQLRAVLAERFHYRTANNYLYALRGILRECFNLGLMTADQYQRAVNFKPIKGSSLPAGRYVEPGEWQRFFASLASDRTPLGIRDTAMFALLWGTGVRKAELLGMEVEDFNIQNMTAIVLGKGNKQREVAVHEQTRPMLERGCGSGGHGRARCSAPSTATVTLTLSASTCPHPTFTSS